MSALRSIVSVTIALTAIGVLWADDQPRKAGAVIFEPASVELSEIGKVEFEYGTIFVPENRSEALKK